MGVTPDDIDLIICTHLHIDHNALGLYYKKARFIVQKKELEAARNPHPIEAPIFPPGDLFETLDYEIIDGDTQVMQGIKILLTPGHTSGGQSVGVETEKGEVIISGLCTTYKNFYPREIHPSQCRLSRLQSTWTYGRSYDSLMRIKKEADIVIPLHCTELVDNLSY